MLQKVDIQLRETQALTLSPTRELAVQIQKVNGQNNHKRCSTVIVVHTLPQVILAIGDYMSVQCHACIGGTNVGEDIRKLDYGQHIVSGTPGRVFGKIKTWGLIIMGTNFWVPQIPQVVLNKWASFRMATP